MRRQERMHPGKWAWLAIAAAFLAPSLAMAQPGPPPEAKERREEAAEKRKAADKKRAEAAEKRDEAREKREEAREERKEAIEDRKEARDELREKRREARDAFRGGASGEEMRKRAHEIVEARKDLAAARAKTRQATKAEVKARLAVAKGEVNKAALTAELRRHARNVAHLARAREVAEAANNDDAIKRIDELTAKENARHARWMANHTK